MFRSKVLFQLSSSFWNLIFIFEIPHFQESALFTLFKGRLFLGGFFAVSLFRAPSLVSRARSVEFWGKQEALLLNFIALQRYSEISFILGNSLRKLESVGFHCNPFDAERWLFLLPSLGGVGLLRRLIWVVFLRKRKTFSNKSQFNFIFLMVAIFCTFTNKQNT